MNKHFIKLLSVIVLELTCHLISYAQSCQHLVVWQKTGEKVYFDLSENPRTTFEGGNLVITTPTLTVNYPVEQVQRYTYEFQQSDIDNINLSKIVRIRHNNDVLYLENLKPDTRIFLYTADGKLLSSQKADSSQTITISLANRPAGVYFVKANDVTYKMLKR